MTSFVSSLTRLFTSSIGRKLVVALTGVALMLFLFVHMSGNLLVFAGAEAFNHYAHLLKGSLHGAGIWIARIGLLVMFGLHVVFTLLLVKDNRAAKGGDSQVDAHVQAKASTRLMAISGLTILCFVIYHIMHYTVHAWNAYDSYEYMLHGEQVHDAYRMVVDGFQWVPASLFYLLGMALLCAHLHHGVSSVFQTLGLRTRSNKEVIELFGKGFAVVIFAGFAIVPLSVMFGIVDHEQPVVAEAGHEQQGAHDSH